MTRTKPNAINYLPYLSPTVLDTALSPDRQITDLHPGAKLVGWQCGFEPYVLAVVDAYDGMQVDEDEADEIATDWLHESRWFASGERREADIIHDVDFLVFANADAPDGECELCGATPGDCEVPRLWAVRDGKLFCEECWPDA
jgi:hypothetical protein